VKHHSANPLGIPQNPPEPLHPKEVSIGLFLNHSRMSPIVEDPFLVDCTYTFDFRDGTTRTFAIKTDLSAQKVQHYVETPPAWAKLEHHQCSTCPLKPDQLQHCPASLAIADIIEYFSKTKSYSTCNCVVQLPQKEVVVRNRPVQDALYPLIGLRLATSLCPSMRFFRPLARFHEPFATTFYTVFRATSYYSLSRHLRNPSNPQVLDFNDLQRFYEHINNVNRQLTKRLEDTEILDATPNSIFVLSLFGISMTMLFNDYLEVLKNLCALGWDLPDEVG
jgi:hypothetical protein